MPTTSLPDDDASLEPLARRVQGLDLARLPDRLAALDEERRRREAAPALDTSAADAALAHLETIAAGEPSWAPLLADAHAALAALTQEVALKLSAERTPEVLSQRLRHLEQAIYQPLTLPSGDEPYADNLRAALTAFEHAFAASQASAQALLRSALQLERMPDQTGAPLDPQLHNILASVAGDDPSRNNTVASQEASGWLLADSVLVRADVTRYASAALPGLPSLDSLPDRRITPGLLGERNPPS